MSSIVIALFAAIAVVILIIFYVNGLEVTDVRQTMTDRNVVDTGHPPPIIYNVDNINGGITETTIDPNEHFGEWRTNEDLDRHRNDRHRNDRNDRQHHADINNNVNMDINVGINAAFIAGTIANTLFAANAGHQPLINMNDLFNGGQNMVVFEDIPEAALLALIPDLTWMLGQGGQQFLVAQETRLQEANIISEGVPGARIDAYAELSKEQTNDKENVHDVIVNSGLKGIIDRLRMEQNDVHLITVDQIMADIRKNGGKYSENRPSLVNDALFVIGLAKTRSYVIAAAAHEDEILMRVWTRAKDKKNVLNEDKIKQAVFDAACDAITTPPQNGVFQQGENNQSTVCVHGRASRYIAALTLLDYDERNWQIRRSEDIKNEIMEYAHEMTKNEAMNIIQTADNTDIKNAAKAYFATTQAEYAALGNITPEAAEAVTNILKFTVGKRIDEKIIDLANDGHTLNAEQTEKIKKNALAAI